MGMGMYSVTPSVTGLAAGAAPRVWDTALVMAVGAGSSLGAARLPVMPSW
jgi:hypothetical protein